MSTRIAVAGDWHGATNWAVGRLMSLGAKHPDVGTLIHVGDFGIWPGRSGQKFLGAVEKAANRNGIEILVVPGNHEDWGRLGGFWDTDPEGRDNDGTMVPMRLTEHVSVLPRGHRFEIGGRSFVALGGAPSVDFDMGRVEGRDWWREEAITPEDVARTIAGGHSDIMITHDSPDRPWMTPEVDQIVHGTNPYGWSTNALAYAAVGRERLTEAFLGVAPRLLVHGRYHVRSSATVELPSRDMCRIEALHRDGHRGNIALLDLATLTVEEIWHG